MAQVTLSGLARGSFYAGVATVWQIASRIILTPFILDRIGLEGFGIWALVIGLSAPAGAVGASFGLAYAKFTAQLDAERDYASLGRLLSSGITAVGGVAVLLLGALALARRPLLELAGVGPELVEPAGAAFLFVAGTVVLQLTLGASLEVLAGLQRTDLRFKATLLSSIVYFFGALATLAQGWGLPGLGLAYLLGEGTGIALAWLWCRWTCPQIEVSVRHVSLRGLRELMSLGGRFQLLFLVNELGSNAFRVLLSAILGPASLGIWEIARRLIRLAKAVSRSVLQPLMPAFAHLHARGEEQRAIRTYRQGSRIVFGLALGSLGFVAAFADTAILVWTGETYRLAAWTTRILAVGFVMVEVTGVTTASLRGRGQVGLELTAALLNLGLRALLTAPLFLIWGYEGFVWAAATGMCVGPLWYLWRFARRESLPVLALLRDIVVMPTLVLAPLIAAAFLIASGPVLDLGIASRRWAGLVQLAIWGVLYTGSAGVVSWLLLLSGGERGAVIEAARRAWPRLGRAAR
jgi:O-antigen/teichoic acid export membrane protein